MKSNSVKVDVVNLSETGIGCTNGSGMTSNVWSPSIGSGNCCNRFWSSRSGSEKSYILVITLLLGSAIVLSALLAYYVTLYKAKDGNLCLGRECVRAAASLMDRMDFEVDPCTNFYDFSCGRFLKTKSVPDDHSSRNILQEMQDEIYVEMKNYLESNIKADDIKSIQKVKLFYASCMNETTANDESEAVAVLLDLITTSGGGWTLLDMVVKDLNPGSALEGSTQLPPKFDLEKRLASAFMHQVQSVFHFYVAPPEKNSTGYALHLYNGNTVLESVYLLNSTRSEDYQHYADAYLELQMSVMRVLAKYKGIEENAFNLTKAREEVVAVFRFEADLANLTKTSSSENGTNDENDENEESSDKIRRPHYSRVTLKELQTEFMLLDWKLLTKYLLQNTSLVLEEILVDSKDYLSELVALVSRHSEKTIDNYFCWAFVARFLPYLGPQFRRLYSDFRREVPDLSVQGPEPKTESGRMFLSRWKECVHLTCEGLKLPSSLLYLQHKQAYLENTNRSVTKMISDIKAAFHLIVDKQSWLKGKEIRAELKARADKIGSKIGFPHFLNDPKEADKFYNDLNIETDDVFIANIIKMARNEMLMELKKLNETLDSDRDWLIQPLISNAYFDAVNDYIILPAGILRYPLVSDDRPMFLNYATLGVVIGHEIAHSFDTLTRKEAFTDKPNTTYWPEGVNEEYEALARCFTEQFSGYKLDTIGETLNGNLTLDENLCDFAGLQQAFTAYRSLGVDYSQRLPGLSQYSSDQLFFIQYAQVWCEVANEEGHRKSLLDSHSPGRYRTNGVIVNSKQFASAFECQPNSPMNPVKKCSLWSYE